MKRRREAEKPASELKSAVQELTLMVDNIKADDAAAATGDCLQLTTKVPIKPFLSLCKLLVEVLDKIGPTMAVFRQDIHQNIQRLENFHESDPTMYRDAVEILKKEVNEGKAKKGPTCSKSFVWLTRTLDFTLALLKLIVKDFKRDMEEMVEESYNITLKPWHGWISSTAYRVAIKLLPDTETFLNILKANGEDNDTLKEHMENLIALLIPVLDHNNDILRTYGLDKLKST